MTKPLPRTHAGESSVVSLLSGWAQQGVQSFFSTQRILLDLAMRQNASMMQSLRQQLSDPHHSPTTIASEVAGEGMTNLIESQKLLFDLAQRQNEILMTGMREHLGEVPAAHTVIDLFRRSVDTFLDMQQEFLKMAGNQTHAWVEAAKTGKPFQGERLLQLTRESMETFVKAQKHFLDVIAEQTAKAGKHTNGAGKKTTKIELSELVRRSTQSFIDTQKKLFDVAGRQMNSQVKAAGKTLELVKPFPLLPFAELTREGVRSYVDAQKALMEVMLKTRNGHKPEVKATARGKRGRSVHKQTAAA